MRTFFIKWGLTLLFGSMVGILFSMRWIGPLTKEALSEGSYDHAPIYYPAWNMLDDYFYYAKVRDVIDGLPFSYDPITVEHRGDLTLHSTYQASYWLGAIGGFFRGNTYDAYYFNNFFLPFLCYILAAILLLQISGFNPLSYLFAFFTTVSGMFWVLTPSYYGARWGGFDLLQQFFKSLHGHGTIIWISEIFRFPNIQMTAPISLIPILLLWQVDQAKPKREMLWWLALSISLGVNAIASSANLLFVYSMLGFYGLLNWRDKSKFWPAVAAGFGSLAISWYAIKISLGTIANLKAYDYPDRTYLDETFFFNKGMVLEVLYLLVPVVALFCIKAKGRNSLRAAALSGLFVYLFTFSLEGWLYASRSVTRGTSVAVGLTGAAALLALAPRARYWARRRIPRRVIIGALALALVGASRSSYRSTMKNLYYANQPTFNSVCKWLSANTTPDDVLVTLDSDFMINLSYCAPTSLYVPQALISSASRTERFHRFLEVGRFYGADRESMLKYIDYPASVSTDINEGDGLQGRQLKLILFYGQFMTETKLPDKTLAEFDPVFSAVAEQAQALTLKATHLMLTPYDRRYLSPNSEAAKAITNKIPLVNIDGYEIYDLQDRR